MSYADREVSTSHKHRHVWMVNHYAAVPSKNGAQGRHLSLAAELVHYGWTASVLRASTIHPMGEQALRGARLRSLAYEAGVPTLWVRSSSYRGNSALRVLGMVSFAVALLMPGMTRGLPRPDVVIGSTVHPLAAWAGCRLAARHKVPFVYEIRDVWPESLIDLGRIPPDSWVAKRMTKLSRRLAHRASLVLSPLPHVDRNIEELGLNTPFLWVSNGFSDYASTTPIVDRAGSFTFMYLGAHGNANALHGTLDAFDEACRLRPDLKLKLRLVGDGPLKSDLERHASTLSAASGIRFEQRIPRSEVISRAQEADCLVVNLLDLPVYRFGVSLNKYFMYLAAGRPIVVASSAPNNPIRDARAGITVPADNHQALVQGLIEMAETPTSVRAEMAHRGQAELRSAYTYPRLAKCLAAGLDGVLEGESRA